MDEEKEVKLELFEIWREGRNLKNLNLPNINGIYRHTRAGLSSDETASFLSETVTAL